MTQLDWLSPRHAERSSLGVSFRYFHLYRLAVATIFVVLGFLQADQWSLGASSHALFSYVALIYWVGAFALVLGADRIWRGEAPRLTFGVLFDIVVLTVLLHATGGIRGGLAFMHVVVLAGAGLVGQGRLAVFYAAFASLAVLFEQGLRWVGQGADVGEFVQVGMVSIGYFGTAVSARLLARRVIANEELARRRGADLAEQVRVNQRVIRDMDDGVLVTDIHGELRQYNPQFRRMLMPLNDPPHTVADFSPQLDVLLQSVRQQGGEQVRRLNLPDGRGEFRVRVVPAGDGGGVLVFLEDLARLQAQARQIKLAALGRLTANIAHEIRNPLSAISQAAELLQEERRGESFTRLLRIIGDNSQRLDRLVRDVLDLGKRDRAEPEAIALRPYLNGFAEEFCLHQPDAQGRIKVEHGVEAALCFDRGHLHQVLWNLLVNALRYASFEPGAVRLRVESSGDVTELHVTDDGAGISEAARMRLFEPFFTTHGKGTGLGLYIARELCEANAASLDFMDNSPGAHFRLRGRNVLDGETWKDGGEAVM